MKRVLITGANSYLGDNTKRYLEEHGDYSVDVLDMLDSDWDKKDFSVYDVVFNVCAIVHQPRIKNGDLYYKVNRDLAFKIAEKAKKEGVKQFIQTSTNGVFGVDVGTMMEKNGFKPRTFYEKSKYEADCMLLNLRSKNFKVCILRPPLIYGSGCKGNFPKLEKFVLRVHFFPKITNRKDFIYIENICDFVRYCIDAEMDEICYPRDILGISISEMALLISTCNSKKMHLLRILNPFVRFASLFMRSFKLVFGSNYCDEAICSDNNWVPPYSTNEAIKKMYTK